jgi:hypothetical protein
MFEALKYLGARRATGRGSLRSDAILTAMLSELMQLLVSSRIFTAVNYRLKRRRLPLPSHLPACRCRARAVNFRDPMRAIRARARR